MKLKCKNGVSIGIDKEGMGIHYRREDDSDYSIYIKKPLLILSPITISANADIDYDDDTGDITVTSDLMVCNVTIKFEFGHSLTVIMTFDDGVTNITQGISVVPCEPIKSLLWACNDRKDDDQ